MVEQRPGVRSLKTLIKDNVGRKGSIQTDDIAAALLQHRNTPIRGLNKSPAELALGRELRDTIPLPTERYRVNPEWAYVLRERERTMVKENKLLKSKHDTNARTLPELMVGDFVRCQNVRTGLWDRSGVVVEVLEYRQYNVKMDGSSRLSLRNRRHLQKVNSNLPNIPYQITTHNEHNRVEQTMPIQEPQQQSYTNNASPESPEHSPEQSIRQSARSNKGKKPLPFAEEFNY